MCHTIHRYAKANNKYMKNYDKNIILLYLMHLDANNLCGWGMSQKLPANGFKWVKKFSKFEEDFIKDYDENSSKGYILQVDDEYPKNWFNLHNDISFLPEREKIEKCNKLVCSIHNKENCVVHIRALKHALDHGLILKKSHRVIQFNQEARSKKQLNNAVFGKTMENVRKDRDIKLVTTDKRRNQLSSELNYHTAKYHSENLLAIEMKKTKVKMNKPVYLGMSIWDISKMLMYEFWYDYIKPKYQDKAKLCYMDTDSFIIHMKTEVFYKNIANDVEKWFDTSYYSECNSVEDDKRPLPVGNNKKVIGFFKDGLGGKLWKNLLDLEQKHMHT